MPGLLSSVSSLTQVLAGLGLVGTLFKPIPPLVDSLQGVLAPSVNPLLAPLGLSLIETSEFNSTQATAHTSTPNTNATATAYSSNPQCVIDPYEVPPPTQYTFPPYNKADAAIYRYRQQQSVNLGGWFALESWMTPSIFGCAGGNRTSELDFAMGWETPELARMVIERHWDTFITEADFATMASMGINTVRVPIGYWSLGPAFLQGTPFEAYSTVYSNAWARVVRAINAAEKYGIGVLLDLHGAPGSQNALPSSGVSNGVESLFLNPADIQKTLAALTFLTQQLAPVSNVVGIQILNEPSPNKNLEMFYNMTIATLRTLLPEALSLPYYIHDSFDLARFSKFVSQRKDFVVLDHHSYFVFDPSDITEAASNHTEDLQSNIALAILDASTLTKRNMIIGEFSCALSQYSLFKESDPTEARRKFCTTQMTTYQNITSGWHFWSWAEEACDSDPNWCFQNVVGKSLPASFSSYDGAMSQNSGVRSQSRPSSTFRNISTSLIDAINAISPSTADLTSDAYNGTLSDIDTVGDLPVTADELGQTANNTVTSNGGPLGLSKRSARDVHIRRKHPRSFTLAGRWKPKKRGPSSSEQAISLGYSEGFETGRSFAARNLSKLGFISQFIEDSLAEHIGNQDIDPVKADYYRQWFAKGLADSEALVNQAIAAAGPSSSDDNNN